MAAEQEVWDEYMQWFYNANVWKRMETYALARHTHPETPV